MVNYLDEDEYERWMSNARNTLKSAESDKASAFYNWTCFKAQQASECAVKAYMRGTGNVSFGRSVSLLLNKAGFNNSLVNISKTIDRYYAQTRYPDAWPEGIPEDYYLLDEANEAITNAGTIIEGVEDQW